MPHGHDQAPGVTCFTEAYIGKMKKVNKRCLLDTPRTVRFSEKTLQVIVQKKQTLVLKEDFSRICANKNYKLLHAYVQCVYILSAKSNYSIKSCGRS